MRRGDRVATCEAVPHPLGLELVVAIGDDIRRTQAFRRTAPAQTTADEWRRSFLDYGWTDEPTTETDTLICSPAATTTVPASSLKIPPWDGLESPACST